MIVVGVVIRNRTVAFPESHKKMQFSNSFPLENMGLAYLEKTSTVMIPYLCIRANSLIRSSFE